MDRKAFLDRVREATVTADLPPAPEDPPGALASDLAAGDLRSRFVERASDVNADVRIVAASQAVDEIVGILRHYQADEYLGWADSQMPIPGIGAGLIARGFSPRPYEVLSSNRLQHQADYFDLQVGITGADGGLAESGSIVLTHGSNRPRMASLIPDAHIAILPASRIVESFSRWAVSQPDSVTRSVNLVIITGPSRTGDIEMHLTQGVHGPRHVHILVIEDH